MLFRRPLVSLLINTVHSTCGNGNSVKREKCYRKARFSYREANAVGGKKNRNFAPNNSFRKKKLRSKLPGKQAFSRGKMQKVERRVLASVNEQVSRARLDAHPRDSNPRSHVTAMLAQWTAGAMLLRTLRAKERNGGSREQRETFRNAATERETRRARQGG